MREEKFDQELRECADQMQQDKTGDKVKPGMRCAMYNMLLVFVNATKSRANKPSFRRRFGKDSSDLDVDDLYELLKEDRLYCRALLCFC